MSGSRSLRMRVSGQSVMNEVVRIHRETPQRSRLARFFGVSPLSAETRGWYRGALGELLVGDTLDNLGPKWDVLHAIPVGSGEPDIDHVVIGPPGVFTVSTTNYSGQEVWVGGTTFMVAGERQPHIRDSECEAKRAAMLLSEAAGRAVTVTAVLVVVDPKKLTIGAPTPDVRIVQSRQLMRWFTRAASTLSGDEVACISNVADQPTTWSTSPALDQDTQQLHRDFAIVRAEVTKALHCRVMWGTAAFLFVYGAAWAAVAAFVLTAVRP